MLDDLGAARCCRVGIEPGLAAGAALGEQVPTLVELHLELVEAVALLRGKPGTDVRPFERVLLLHKLVDRVQQLSILHGVLLSALNGMVAAAFHRIGLVAPPERYPSDARSVLKVTEGRITASARAQAGW